MKFLFYPQALLPIHGSILSERPLGGTETGLIHLADALAKRGHEVVVLTTVENPPLSNPLYLPFRALQDVGPVDVLVAIREWMPLLSPIAAKRRLFWTGDSYDQPQNLGIGDIRVRDSIDALLAVSNWHADTLCAKSRFPREKAWVIGNGVSLDQFKGTETRKRKRLIYSSTPYRGLQLVPLLYRELQRNHPDLELHVFSGYAVYGGDQTYGPEAKARYDQLVGTLRSLPGVTVHGNILQKDLAREFMRSSILFYPNTFEETSCITALEAQAAGCVVLSSKYGALPETVGDSGILIPGIPGSQEYLKSFLRAANQLLIDDEMWEHLSTRSLELAQGLDWGNVAARLEGYLLGKATVAQGPLPRE